MHPCTVLLHDDMAVSHDSGTLQEQWDQASYESLRTYLSSSLPLPETHPNQNQNQNQTSTLLTHLTTAHHTLKTHARNTRLGLALFKLVQRFLFKAGYAKASSARANLDLMAAALRGKIAKKEGGYLVSLVRCVV